MWSKALHSACRANDAQAVTALLSSSSETIDVNAVNHEHRSALHEAIDSVDCVRLLLDAGAEVESWKHGEWTPLMTASTKGRLDVALLLLDAGANPTFRNRDGWTPVHLASREGHPAVLQALIARIPNPDVIIRSSTRNGTTPIATAALHGHRHVIELLLRHGGDASVGDQSGCTPLMKASLGAHTDVVHLLTSVLNDADIAAVDGAGRSAAHFAAQGGADDCIRLLASHPAGRKIMEDKDATSEWTPAHCAAREGRSKVIDTLKDIGVSIDIKDKKGRTPLMVAQEYGHKLS